MQKHLNTGERVTVQVLLEKGVPIAQIAEMLEVDEKTVRYHRDKNQEKRPDGRKKKVSQVDEYKEVIEEWMKPRLEQERPPNVEELCGYLKGEHNYKGSYKAVLRYVRRHYPAPAIRTYRRVETIPGAQMQTDWGEFPEVELLDGTRGLHAFVMVLSHSRQVAVIWSRDEKQLSWLHCHNEAFRRLQGIAAVNRVDNLKTAVAQGAGAWSRLNPVYRSYAKAVKFHIDACAPRAAYQKGKVEAKVLLSRLRLVPSVHQFVNMSELQQWTDEEVLKWSQEAICPATGESVYQSWQAEIPFLAEVPHLPEPFDLVVTRTVRDDCMVCFEGRQYQVPFLCVRQQVEVHGCAHSVQFFREGKLLCEYPRGTKQRILLDPNCCEGQGDGRVLPPPPLGRMGQKLQELMNQPVEQRPIDLYAALAEVARHE